MVYDLLLTYFICIILIFVFFIMGLVIDKLFRLKLKGLYNIVLGFFAYYILFEIFYLPFFFFKWRLSTLAALWIGFLSLFILISIITLRESILHALIGIWQQIRCNNIICVLVSLAVFIAVLYYTTRSFYYGMDTAFYIGMVNNAVHYDRMLVYHSEMGYKEEYLDFRYGLSGFYMHTAVLCKMFKISAIIMQKQGMAIINVIISYCIAFLIGKRIYKKETGYAYLFVAIYFAMTFCFLSIYVPGQFLLYRAYEAKSFCCNIVIPALHLVMYSMMRSKEIKSCRWKQLFIITNASIPISMSSILIIPVLVIIFSCTMAVKHKKIKYVLFGGVCCISNAVFLVLYYLYTIGKLVIMV